MDLNDIKLIFDRAFIRTFSKKKLLFVFVGLLVCELLVLFFKALSMHSGQWIGISLIFLPIFLCTGVLLSIGVLLIRLYHDEIKKKTISYWATLNQSWDLILGSSYLSIPIILSYLVLWMLLGIFFLLNDMPGIGGFFSVILAFGPFILNMGSLVLCLICIAMLFFVTPIIALRGLNRLQLAQMVAARFQNDIFFNLLFIVIAITPLILLGILLSISAMMTEAFCVRCDEPVYLVLHWFFMMVPFTAFLAPAVIFFFNFAAESHVLMQKTQRKSFGK